MQKAGQMIPLTQKVKKLRATLILEETKEVLEALGYKITGNCSGGVGLSVTRALDNDHLIKELCDLIVVTTGTAIAFGIDIELYQDLVDQNNLEKIGKSEVRADGKIIKPKGFKSPLERGNWPKLI